MDARVSRLETHMEYVSRDIAEIRESQAKTVTVLESLALTVNGLAAKFEQTISGLSAKIEQSDISLSAKIEHTEMKLTGEMQVLRGDMQVLRGDMKELRGDMKELPTKTDLWNY